MRVLLVEDEANLAKVIKMNLELEGYEVDHSSDGTNALDRLNQGYYDIVVLDLMLPKLSGMDVLAAMRLQNTETPVIIVSAKDTSTDRITGLKMGADDYLNKPFEIEELIIRMQKLLGRSQTTQAARSNVDMVKFGKNSIDYKTYLAHNGEKEIQLSKKEFMIMKLLISKKNEVVSRQEILKNVWGYDVFPTTRTIDNFISALRKYFEVDIKDPQHIKSIRGVGYKFIE